MSKKKIDKFKKNAERYIRKGDFLKAIDEYKAILDIEGEDPTYLNYIGDLYIKDNKKSLAIQYFMQAIEAYEEQELFNNAVAMCKKILRQETKPDVYKIMGRLLAKQGFNREAIDNYRKFIQHNRDKKEEIFDLYDKMLGLDPKDLQIYLEYAHFLEVYQRSDEAMKVYRKALENFENQYNAVNEIVEKMTELDPKSVQGIKIDNKKDEKEQELIGILDGLTSSGEEEEAKIRAEEEARRKAAEAKRKAAEEEAKRIAEEESKIRAEEEARRKAAEEAKHKVEEETKRKAAEEARLKAEEETKRKAAEAKRKSDEEAKRKAEEEAKTRAEEEARRKAATEAKHKVEEEARRKSEIEAKRKAEEEARRKAKAEEEEKKKKAEEEARRKVKQAEEARKKKIQEDLARIEEEAKQKATEEARKRANELEKQRLEDEEKKRKEEEEELRIFEEEIKLEEEENRRKEEEKEEEKKKQDEAKRRVEEAKKKEIESSKGKLKEILNNYSLTKQEKKASSEIDQILEEQNATIQHLLELESMVEELKEGFTSTVSVDADNMYDLGIMYKDMGLYEEAIVQFKQIITTHKDDIRAYEMIGEIYLEKEELDRAMVTLKRGINMSKDNPEQAINLHYMLAQAFEKRGYVKSAIKELKEVYAVNKNFKDTEKLIKRYVLALRKIQSEKVFKDAEDKKSASETKEEIKEIFKDGLKQKEDNQPPLKKEAEKPQERSQKQIEDELFPERPQDYVNNLEERSVEEMPCLNLSRNETRKTLTEIKRFCKELQKENEQSEEESESSLEESDTTSVTDGVTGEKKDREKKGKRISYL